MALGSTQPLTEMSTRSISWGKGGRYVRLTTLPPSCAVVMKFGNLIFLEPSGPLQACNGTAFCLTLPVMTRNWIMPVLALFRAFMLLYPEAHNVPTKFLRAFKTTWFLNSHKHMHLAYSQTFDVFTLTNVRHSVGTHGSTTSGR